MKFKYYVFLKNGYKPTMEDERETEIEFVIEAKNRVTADRMVKAMLGDNVEEFDGFAIN